MTAQIRELGARLRNLFQTGEFRRRYGDGRIQVQTHNNRVVERAEAFPYGFRARAKNGRALVVCQGGNVGSFEILPLLPSDDVTPPNLEDGDVALYTGEGGRIVLRESGAIEISASGPGNIAVVGESGKLHLGNGATCLRAELAGLIDDIKSIVTTGSPNSHTVLPASQQRLDMRKNSINRLLKEGA